VAEIKVDLDKAVDIDWTSEKEYWNTYKLEDGTLMKVKLVLRGVKRTDQHNPDGTPIYIINSANIVRVSKVSKKLMKKPKKAPQSQVV
jgi:hypothetical protein